MIDKGDEIENYNQRQLNLMLRIIREYKNDHIRFARMVADLDSLIEALEDPAIDVREKLESCWGRLEDTYAVMLDQERTVLNDFDKQFIDETLSEFESFIKTHILN